MALTRVYGRVVYPHGEGTPTPVTGDGVIEYVHASPGLVDGAVHGPDRHRREYTDGIATEAWLKPGMWRAYVYPDQGRSYTLHLGVPETGETTIADAVGEIVPDGIVTKGDPGPAGASVTGGRDNGDGTVSFELSDGTYTDPVTVPPGPAGRGIVSISDPDADSLVTITFTDGTETTVQAIRGDKGDTGDTGPASTVPGPAGPPGAVPTASDYLVVGPGRPDAPTTTGLSSAQIAALPVGCEYRSTDGAGTGAWVWMKQPAGWVVTQGDTGWRAMPITVAPWNGAASIKVRRTRTTVLIEPHTPMQYGVWRLAGIDADNAAIQIGTLPPGWSPGSRVVAPVVNGSGGAPYAALGKLMVSPEGSAAYANLRHQASNSLTVSLRYETTDPWPTTLPGTSA